MMVNSANDGLLQANDGKMLGNGGEMYVNDGEMSIWSYAHVTIIDEHFTIIGLIEVNHHLLIWPSLRSCTNCSVAVPNFPEIRQQFIGTKNNFPLILLNHIIT